MDNYAILKTKLQLGKSSNIKYVSENDIDDIRQIKINTQKPKVERFKDFIEKAKNPYMFNIDGMKVKFEFSDSDVSISQCLENLIINRLGRN